MRSEALGADRLQPPEQSPTQASVAWDEPAFPRPPGAPRPRSPSPAAALPQTTPAPPFAAPLAYPAPAYTAPPRPASTIRASSADGQLAWPSRGGGAATAGRPGGPGARSPSPAPLLGDRAGTWTKLASSAIPGKAGEVVIPDLPE